MTPREVLEKAGKDTIEQNCKMENIVLEKENKVLKEMLFEFLLDSVENSKELERFLAEPLTVKKISNFIKKHKKQL